MIGLIKQAYNKANLEKFSLENQSTIGGHVGNCPRYLQNLLPWCAKNLCKVFSSIWRYGNADAYFCEIWVKYIGFMSG